MFTALLRSLNSFDRHRSASADSYLVELTPAAIKIRIDDLCVQHVCLAEQRQMTALDVLGGDREATEQRKSLDREIDRVKADLQIARDALPWAIAAERAATLVEQRDVTAAITDAFAISQQATKEMVDVCCSSLPTRDAAVELRKRTRASAFLAAAIADSSAQRFEACDGLATLRNRLEEAIRSLDRVRLLPREDPSSLLDPHVVALVRRLQRLNASLAAGERDPDCKQTENQ